MRAELPWVLPPERVDEERLDDDQAGAAGGATPIVRDVALAGDAVNPAQSRLDRRERQSVDDLDRSQLQVCEGDVVHRQEVPSDVVDVTRQ